MARILFVSTSTTIGGAEKTLHALATRLDPKRFVVSGVVSLKPEGDYARRLRAAGVKVESLGLEGMPGLSDARRLASIIAREKPDVVHALMYQAIQLSRAAKSLAPVPFRLVSSPRVTYRRGRSWWTLALDRALKGRDDLLIAECEASRRFLIESRGYSPAKARTILNGVEAAPSPSPAERAAARSELRLKDSNVLFGAMGRVDRQKGFAVLVEALSRLKGSPPRCAILGDGPERAGLRELIRRRGLEDSVFLLGERPDTAAWLSAFDAFVLPSLWEGLPNALLEAMSRGLPVVASAVDGVPEAVTDGRDGLLVPPSDPEALAVALQTLANDRARRASLGAAAKKTIADRFALSRMIADYERAYTDVLA